jgi:hypothetical protein
MATPHITVPAWNQKPRHSPARGFFLSWNSVASIRISICRTGLFLTQAHQAFARPVSACMHLEGTLAPKSQWNFWLLYQSINLPPAPLSRSRFAKLHVGAL